MHLQNDPDPAPHPDYLWRVLREYIRTVFNLFGDPLDLARKVWVHRDEANFIRDALRPLEIMLRRLIFARALAHVNAEPAPPPPPSAPKRQRTRRDPYNLDNSASWHASFDLGMERRPLGPPAPSPALLEIDANTPAGAPAVQDHHARLPNADFTRGVALRYEALLRGFENPDALVARMARILQRDRGRVTLMLSPLRERDRAKPFFREAALTIELARETFQTWLMQLLPRPALNSS